MRPLEASDGQAELITSATIPWLTQLRTTPTSTTTRGAAAAASISRNSPSALTDTRVCGSDRRPHGTSATGVNRARPRTPGGRADLGRSEASLGRRQSPCLVVAPVARAAARLCCTALKPMHALAPFLGPRPGEDPSSARWGQSDHDGLQGRETHLATEVSRSSCLRTATPPAAPQPPKLLNQAIKR